MNSEANKPLSGLRIKQPGGWVFFPIFHRVNSRFLNFCKKLPGDWQDAKHLNKTVGKQFLDPSNHRFLFPDRQRERKQI